MIFYDPEGKRWRSVKIVLGFFVVVLLSTAFFLVEYETGFERIGLGAGSRDVPVVQPVITGFKENVRSYIIASKDKYEYLKTAALKVIR